MEKLKDIYIKDGEWVKVSEYDTCCDCHLVHKVDYRIKDGVLERRNYRQEKLTAQYRGRLHKKEKQKLPDFICDLKHCSLCQKFRKDNGFPVKGRYKLTNN